ncbi:uncharacterized protein LOC144701422 [Wolffia australiana]
MANLRSKSCVDWRAQDEESRYKEGTGPYDQRSYSMRYAPPYSQPAPGKMSFKNGKNSGDAAKSSTSKGWTLSDPEMQRKKRVAGYKMYSAEGKIKMSFRRSFKWIKDRCTMVVYGW